MSITQLTDQIQLIWIKHTRHCFEILLLSKYLFVSNNVWTPEFQMAKSQYNINRGDQVFDGATICVKKGCPYETFLFPVKLTSKNNDEEDITIIAIILEQRKAIYPILLQHNDIAVKSKLVLSNVIANHQVASCSHAFDKVEISTFEKKICELLKNKIIMPDDEITGLAIFKSCMFF
jgi:hypothetical protein